MSRAATNHRSLKAIGWGKPLIQKITTTLVASVPSLAP